MSGEYQIPAEIIEKLAKNDFDKWAVYDMWNTASPGTKEKYRQGVTDTIRTFLEMIDE